MTTLSAWTYDSVNLITVIAVFGLVLAVWIALVTFWAARRSLRQQRLGQRLESAPNVGKNPHVLRLWRDGMEATTVIPSDEDQFSPWRRWERWCKRGDLSGTPKSILGLLVVISAIAFAIAYGATYSASWGAVAVLGVAMVFRFYVNFRISRQTVLFEKQFLDALSTAARSLRAGHPLLAAFRVVSEEIAAPAGRIFSEICQEQELGVNLEESLRHAASEAFSPDLKLFSASVIIQIRSGGNLADMMERLAVVIRDRIRIARRIRVLTAQTQFSKKILVALPIVLFVLLNLANPAYMQSMYGSRFGQYLLAAAGAMVLLGMWVMSRLTVLNY